VLGDAMPGFARLGSGKKSFGGNFAVVCMATLRDAMPSYAAQRHGNFL
jgi:hypothetical protein